jgi:drug/metabolite transporter (DMT)-like permease
MTKRGMLLFSANSIIWGIPFWLTKILLTEFNASTIVFLRAGIAAALLVPITWRSGALQQALSQWRWVLVFALAQIAIPWWLTGNAQRHLDSSFTGLLMTAIPVIGLFYAFVFRESSAFSLRGTLGLMIGIFGVTILIGLDAFGGHLNFFSVFLVLIATFGFAYAPRVVAHHLHGVPSLGAVALTVLITSVIWVIPGVASWPKRTLSLHILFAVLLLGVVCTALAFWIFFEIIKEIGPTKTTYLAFTNPMVAVLVGVVVAKEPLTIGIICGFPLIVVGTYMAISARTKIPVD